MWCACAFALRWCVCVCVGGWVGGWEIGCVWVCACVRLYWSSAFIKDIWILTESKASWFLGAFLVAVARLHDLRKGVTKLRTSLGRWNEHVPTLGTAFFRMLPGSWGSNPRQPPHACASSWQLSSGPGPGHRLECSRALARDSLKASPVTTQRSDSLNQALEAVSGKSARSKVFDIWNLLQQVFMGVL